MDVLLGHARMHAVIYRELSEGPMPACGARRSEPVVVMPRDEADSRALMPWCRRCLGVIAAAVREGQDASHVELGGRISAPAAQLAVPGALADDTPRPSDQGAHHPENADSRTPRQSGSAVRTPKR